MLYGEEHVRRYEETNGEEGHDWQPGVPCLILTTKGRKSGEDRKFPLIYQEVDGDYVIVASKGGDPKHPGWYLNLQANPEVKVQVRADKFTARARTARRRGAREALARHGEGVAGLRRVPEEDRPEDPRRRPRTGLISASPAPSTTANDAPPAA